MPQMAAIPQRGGPINPLVHQPTPACGMGLLGLRAALLQLVEHLHASHQVVHVAPLESRDLRVAPLGPSPSTTMVIGQVAPIPGNVLTLPDVTITTTLDASMGGWTSTVVCQGRPHLVKTECQFAQPSSTSPLSGDGT